MKKVLIGRFGKVFGIKGWITIRSFTDPTENILQYSPWLIKHNRGDEFETLTIEASKVQHKNIIVKLPNINNPEEARLYTNINIYVDRDVLPKPNQEEFYWADLEGMEVINEQKINLGKVSYVTNTGANDILIVKDAKRERWIPYTDDAIKKVDQDSKTIFVDWDEDF